MPRMAVNGLFSSCAKPPIICPMAAMRSLWMICCSSFFSTEMSRTEIIAPLRLPFASKSWLAVARIVRQLPSRCPGAIFGSGKRLFTGNHVPIKCHQFRRMVVQILDLLAQQLFRPVAQQIANPRADEAVTLLEIDH